MTLTEQYKIILRNSLDEAKKSKKNDEETIRRLRSGGMRRAATVAGEGLSGMYQSGRHTLTGLNMMRKHATRGTSEFIRKRPIKSVVAAGLLAAAATNPSAVYSGAKTAASYTGEKISDLYKLLTAIKQEPQKPDIRTLVKTLPPYSTKK